MRKKIMQIIETFGHYVENLTDKKPQSARRLLKTGWEAQNLKFRYMQDKRLMPADRHLANLMMDTMLRPLQKPEDSVIVSIFTPCEMMQEVGLHPYNVEGFSCYLSASKAERAFLQQAENQGIAETLCSYHKTFLGAAQKGLLPKPKCIVYTNLTCDANLLTFRTLADFYQVPVFAIDVPWNQTTENVQYVADQLKDLKIFLEKNTGKTVAFFYITTNGSVNIRKPGDYTSKMIELAGGNYLFSAEDLNVEENALSTMNIQMETFYAAAKDADYLIYNSTIDGDIPNMEQFLQKSPLLADLKAVKEQHVWCTKQNLFQQTTGAADMIADFHEIVTGAADGKDQLTYLHRIS